MISLSTRADQILRLAKQIGREFGQGYVGTEHLLLAIVREGTGLGARILLEQSTEAGIREQISKLQEHRPQETWVLGRLPGTPHFKDVLAKAVAEARGRGNWQVCSGHLLLALLAEGGCVAAEVLKNLGITDQQIRKALTEEEAESRAAKASAPTQ